MAARVIAAEVAGAIPPQNFMTPLQLIARPSNAAAKLKQQAEIAAQQKILGKAPISDQQAFNIRTEWSPWREAQYYNHHYLAGFAAFLLVGRIWDPFNKHKNKNLALQKSTISDEFQQIKNAAKIQRAANSLIPVAPVQKYF